MTLIKAIYVHLITKKKYNTLQIKLDGAREDIERLTIQLNTAKREHAIRRNEWERILKEQEEEIIRLKERGKKNVSKPNSNGSKIPRKVQNNK